MNNLTLTKVLLLAGILLVTKTSIAQQEIYTQVVDATISTYSATSYEYMHGVVLSPGFAFTANSTYPVFSIVPAGQKPHPDNTSLAANNNVRTDVIKVGGVTDPSQITPTNSQTQISYMDGFGRPVERVVAHGSPLLKDIVEFMSYDQYGRQSKQYLPYTATTGNGSYQVNPSTAQLLFYQTTGQQVAVDNYPYAITNYDNSPLERVLEIGAPGASWQPGAHTVKTQARLNAAADNIALWTSAGPGGSNYGIAQLSVNDITDENGNHVLTFTNKLGQVVDRKVQADAGVWLETVYIYDDIGNVLFQVSPEGVKRIYAATASWGTAFINTWTTSYTYDAKARLIAKQAPGAAPVCMVYDSYNRLALMQDGRLRNAYGGTDKWYFTKYDAANRVIVAGLYTYTTPPNPVGTTNQQILQNYLDGLTYDNISTFASEKRAAGTTYGFSNQSFPTTVADADVLSVNYYDDYDFNNSGTPPNSYQNPSQTGFATTATIDASGFLTGTKKRIINTGGNNGGWINQAVFYDDFGNPIQKQTNNLINQGALDITSNAYDIYAGHITQTKQVKTQGTTIAVVNKMNYDLMDRLTQVAVNINNGADQVIASYEYNELGQLKDKKLGKISGGANAGNYLQTVDYRYNIRGWLTSINNSTLMQDATNSDNIDVWGETILYDQTDATGLSNTPKFNGKISTVKWKVNDQFSASANPVRQRSYIYTYDAVGRLKTAHYAANNGTDWTVEAGGYDEAIGSYDANGNIQSLQRNTLASGATMPTQIDNLTYTYQNSNASNQLANVADLSNNTMGFNDSASLSAEYQYDTNGNLVQDANKNQTIYYNDLNKVSKVSIAGGGSIEYIYDASGVRIRKTVFNAAHTAINQYDYMDGFVYGSSALSFFNTAEGRVLAGSSFTFEYFIKDHLGNTRVSFQDNGSGVAKITQDNEYYAFGLTMQGMVVRTAQPSPGNKQLFNGGSELQDDLGYENSYSTPSRQYDPQLGRFNAIDQAVDKYAEWSPYNFAFNDPVAKNDPNGADPCTGPCDARPFWTVPGYNYFPVNPYSPGGYAQNVWSPVFSQFNPAMQSLILQAINNMASTDSRRFENLEGVWGYFDSFSNSYYNSEHAQVTDIFNGLVTGLTPVQHANWTFVPLDLGKAYDWLKDNLVGSTQTVKTGIEIENETFMGTVTYSTYNSVTHKGEERLFNANSNTFVNQSGKSKITGDLNINLYVFKTKFTSDIGIEQELGISSWNIKVGLSFKKGISVGADVNDHGFDASYKPSVMGIIIIAGLFIDPEQTAPYIVKKLLTN